MPTADKSTILLQRSSNFFSGFNKFEVQIDGRRQGTIANGKSERYSVTLGKHLVQVKDVNYKSEPLELNLSKGE